MSGIYPIRRETTASNYIGSTTVLNLPTKVLNRPNDASYRNGAFPEFFNVIKSSSYYFDAGILWRDGSFYVFLSTDTGTVTSSNYTWIDTKLSSVSKGSQVTLKTYFNSTGTKIIAEVFNSTGTISRGKAECSNIKSAASSAFANGSKITRVTSLAVNLNASGSVTLPADCYYVDMLYKGTTLIKKDNTDVKLRLNNSSLTRDVADNDFKNYTAYYACNYNPSSDSYEDSSGYVYDRSSATLKSKQYS